MIERIVPIVEGHGEVIAVPELLRRLMNEMGRYVDVERPQLFKRSGVTKPGLFEAKVQRAAIDAGDAGAILVLLDSDHLTPGEDPPCVLGPKLLARAKAARADKRIVVCLAEVEFESWLIACAESLRGIRKLPHDISRPMNFEKIGGAKEWLSNQMPDPHRYTPTADQAALVAKMDLDLAREHSRSFRRFCNRLRELLA